MSHTSPAASNAKKRIGERRLYPAGISGNERADRLASRADITSGLQLGRTEVFRGLRNFLNMDRPEHHSIDRLKKRGGGNEAADIPPSEVGIDLWSSR